MGKIFGILIFVLGLWFTAHTVVQMREPSSESESAIERTQKARDAVLRAQQQGEERRRRLLNE